jgi:hypothetical protein
VFVDSAESSVGESVMRGRWQVGLLMCGLAIAEFACGWVDGWKLDESREEESFWARKLGVVLHAPCASSSHLSPEFHCQKAGSVVTRKLLRVGNFESLSYLIRETP